MARVSISRAAGAVWEAGNEDWVRRDVIKVSEADTCSESDYLSYVSHEIGVSWQSPRVTCTAARAEIIITSAECCYGGPLRYGHAADLFFTLRAHVELDVRT